MDLDTSCSVKINHCTFGFLLDPSSFKPSRSSSCLIAGVLEVSAGSEVCDDALFSLFTGVGVDDAVDSGGGWAEVDTGLESFEGFKGFSAIVDEIGSPDAGAS